MRRARAELEKAIAGISNLLKHSMPNLERALLVADRDDAKKELARLDEAEKVK